MRINQKNFNAGHGFNAAVEELSSRGGGLIRLDGQGDDLVANVPLVNRPGVEVVGVGVPSVYNQTRTRIHLNHDQGPVLVTTNQRSLGGTEYRSWGASKWRNITVYNPRSIPNAEVLRFYGGNHSEFDDITAQSFGGGFEYGIRTARYPGREAMADGQYSNFHRIKIYTAKYPLYLTHNVPDIAFHNSLFYGKWHGGPVPGSVAVTVKNTNSVRFYECTNQFTETGWQFTNTKHMLVIGGAWEAFVQWLPRAARYAIETVNASDTEFIGHSVANISRVQQLIKETNPLRNKYDLLGVVNPVAQ